MKKVANTEVDDIQITYSMEHWMKGLDLSFYADEKNRKLFDPNFNTKIEEEKK